MPTKMKFNDVKIDNSAVVKIVGGMGQRGVANAANKTVTRVRQSIRAQDRIYTREMLDGTKAEFDRTSQPMRPTATVTLGHGQVGVWQEYGTRAHGPRHAPRMVFQIRGKGPVIFAKWVRGVTPGKFMQTAYAQLTFRDFIADR